MMIRLPASPPQSRRRDPPYAKRHIPRYDYLHISKKSFAIYALFFSPPS